MAQSSPWTIRRRTIVATRGLTGAATTASADRGFVESAIVGLALAIEARDPYMRGHCRRLASYALAFGRHLGLSRDDLAALRRGAYLHDVGKIAVADAILRKPGRLTPEELGSVQQHPVVGHNLCVALGSLAAVRPIVRSHHERLDGSGYPDGLSGGRVPLLAQIMAIVDVYDALTTARAYKPALPAETAYRELAAEAAKGWRRPDLVEEFISLGRRGGLVPPAMAETMPRSAPISEAVGALIT